MFTEGDTISIEAYTDADWAGSIDDWRSTAGYLTFVGETWLHGEAKNKKL